MLLERVMKFTEMHILIIGILAIVIGGGCAYSKYWRREGFQFTRVGGYREGFRGDDDNDDTPVCNVCNKPKPSCGCRAKMGRDAAANSSSSSSNSSSSSSATSGGSLSGIFNKVVPAPVAPCPRTMEPDLSKYILKSQVPTTASLMPDLSNYMLKTECPAVPDLSKYVLKSSIPKPQPVIIDNSSCKKDAGECPPCPRPRCPEVKCPPPTKCAPPAPCPRPVCPPTVVKCKSEETTQSTVRPFLAPLNMGTFGMA